jgi:hypothetical protein
LDPVGELEEEQGGSVLPGAFDALHEGDFAGWVDVELMRFDEGKRCSATAEEVVVEGEEQGVEAAAIEEAAVVFLAGAPGGVAGWELAPAGARGELPEDGVEQGTRGGVGTAAGRASRWKRFFLEDGERGEAAVFLEVAEGLARARGMVDEAPAVGRDEGRRDAAQVVYPGIYWQKRREKAPLGV